ncbi:MAG: ABC transporter ATP-binding protein [Deltaproteobacteria bacterium]|nr:ABC transporter ATP-binding protein [Deltaproteobacteria bacterium]
MLDVRGVSVRYGDLQALWDVTFAVRAGELVAIIGPNGAGKTTILKTILGLVRPAAGSIDFRGAPLTRYPPYDRVARGIALVPEGRRIFPNMSVRDTLELGAYTAGRRADLRPRVERVYDLFPVLASRQRQAAGTLSGGEQQMLAIGRALMADPALLMLDEPSLGLAPVVIDHLYDRLGELKGRGLTILLVEQYVAGALELADRAYVLETGRIVREGAGHELLADDYIQKTYLAL